MKCPDNSNLRFSFENSRCFRNGGNSL